MTKAMHCDCEYHGKWPLTISRCCLYHLTLYQLIDEARDAMAGNENWTMRAQDFPSADEFPLDSVDNSSPKRRAVPTGESRG